MSFTNQKPWTVTDEDMKRPWSGFKDGRYFRCRLCGYRFQPGDTCRWVFANFSESPYKYGNFFTCTKCDGENILERTAAPVEESKQTLWWLWEKWKE